jgi:hypothetical protein
VTGSFAEVRETGERETWAREGEGLREGAFEMEGEGAFEREEKERRGWLEKNNRKRKIVVGVFFKRKETKIIKNVNWG